MVLVVGGAVGGALGSRGDPWGALCGKDRPLPETETARVALVPVAPLVPLTSPLLLPAITPLPLEVPVRPAPPPPPLIAVPIPPVPLVAIPPAGGRLLA